MIKKHIFSKIVATALIATMIFATTGCGTKVEIIEKKDVNNENVEEVKKEEKLRAQDDFYGYVNKDTILSYELSSNDIGAGAAYEIQEQVNEEIAVMVNDFISSEAKYEEGSNEWAVCKTYNQLMNYADTKESTAKEDFLGFVDRVNAIKGKQDALTLFGELANKYGVCNLLSLDVSTDFKKSNQNALYLFQTDYCFEEKLKSIYEGNSERKNLNSYIVDMLVMSGMDVESARNAAMNYLYYIVDVACETDFSVDDVANPYETLTYYKNEEINNELDGISIEELFDALNIKTVDGLYVQDLKQTVSILSLLKEENIDLVKTYLICAYINQYKSFLIEDYPVLNAYTLKYDKDNEAAMASVLQETMEWQISELYSDYYFTEEMEEELLKMYEDIKSGYEELINKATWLSENSREGLILKLHNMKFVYGGGKKWVTKENNKAVIGKDFYETYRNAKVFKMQSVANNLKQKPDLEIIDMTSQTINAQYTPSNVFTVTVAIMHAPYFDLNASYEENLGGLGMVIGHEMGHAFDSNGFKYDSDGNYNEEWISKEDSEELERRLIELENYYSNYSVLDVYYVDGEQTAGENYADLGAMECLMTVVKDNEGRKKLFENYAKIWCEFLEDKDGINRISNDEHSPSIVRVNAVVASIPEFYDVFDVKEQDGMYVAPEKRVSRWH